MSDRELDVVVHGATGFTGRLVARYLLDHAPAGTRIALSGRSRERLAQVGEGLGPAGADLPLLVADSHDDDALADLAARTRVVATTVGPYERHGLPLVRACATAGTDYVDLTGEVLFMRASIDACHAAAAHSGARVVHACGFDSVPSDVGVHLLATTAAAHGLGRLEETRFLMTGAAGGVGGGTVATAQGVVERLASDPDARRVALDPYALSPDRAREPDRTVDAPPGDGPDPWGVRWDAVTGRWLAPYVMGVVNSRVVRRSNALTGWSYGRGFRYEEAIAVPGRVVGAPVAAAVAAGTLAGAAAFAVPPVRRLLDRVLPEAGTGPDEASLHEGWFAARLHARTTSGRVVEAVLRSPGDPGYVSTARMLGEAALALVHDRDRLPDRAGVLTPATAFGDVLLRRLRAAGVTFRAL
ncbi:saccharopine dehydrogenase family protein [Aquipuribacter nitratireducens]|uniref:Saccharopine dehydrogenase family protein n=1 Tax=Aquipuribacter nitratireducens TaxID=650104 RepID=A0ABW0GMQ4_9MICO